MASDRVIGRENDLPWHLPADLKHFKSLTMGHHLLVGRKTYESIGRPLPGRKMIVLSRSELDLPEEVAVCSSDPRGSSRECRTPKRCRGGRRSMRSQLFIAGGAEIYRQTIDLADTMYVTEIDLQIEGDAHFPEIDLSVWSEVAREPQTMDDKNRIPYTFVRYERKRKVVAVALRRLAAAKVAAEAAAPDGWRSEPPSRFVLRPPRSAVAPTSGYYAQSLLGGAKDPPPREQSIETDPSQSSDTRAGPSRQARDGAPRFASSQAVSSLSPTTRATEPSSTSIETT